MLDASLDSGFHRLGAVVGSAGDAQGPGDVFGAPLRGYVPLSHVGNGQLEGFVPVVRYGGGLVQAPVEPGQVAAGLGGVLPHHVLAGPDAPDREQVRIPTVAQHRRPLHGGLAAARNPDGRVGFLYRGWQQGNVIEVEELAVVVYAFLGPEPLHHFQHLVGAPAPGADRNADGVELHFGSPLAADADTEVEPAVGDAVEAGHQLGKHHRVIQGHDDDAGHHPEATRRPGGGRHRRYVEECGAGRVAVHDVLAHGNSLKTHVLGAAGKLRDVPIVFGTQAATEGDGHRSSNSIAAAPSTARFAGILNASRDRGNSSISGPLS